MTAVPPLGRPVGPPPVKRIRWGLGDFFIVWFSGLGAATLGFMIGIAIGGYDLEESTSEPLALGVSALAQFAGTILALWLVSRVKGRGSLRHDFGLHVDWRRDWWFLPLGAGFQIAAAIMLVPFAVLDEREQEIVEQLKDASGAGLLLLVFGAVLLAPIIEELLYRGLLLRSLLRKMSPAWAVGVSSTVFGAVHLVDPNAIVVLPALVFLGVVAAVITLRSGRIGRAVLLHAGFNSVTAIPLLFT